MQFASLKTEVKSSNYVSKFYERNGISKSSRKDAKSYVAVEQKRLGKSFCPVHKYIKTTFSRNEL